MENIKNLLEKAKAFFINYNVHIGLLLSVLGIYLAFFPPSKNPNLIFQYKVIDLVKMNELNKDLKIYYLGEDIRKSNLNLKAYSVTLKNIGKGDLGTRDYDSNVPFGLEIKNGVITGVDFVEASNNDDYLKDIFANKLVDSTRIILKKKIIKSKQAIKLKFTVIHKNNVNPELVPLGKICNGDIKVTEEDESDDLTFFDIILVFTIMLAIAFGLGLIVYCFKWSVQFVKANSRKITLKNKMAYNFDQTNKSHRLILAIYSILGRKKFVETVKSILNEDELNKKIKEENIRKEIVKNYGQLAKEKVIERSTDSDQEYSSDFLDSIELIDKAGGIKYEGDKIIIDKDVLDEAEIFLKNLKPK